ncbi:MAG: DUF4013 domain-containing protein [Anaerolineae bacterium]
MEMGKAFTYIFDDESWITKILIGGILGIIPIVNFAVLGYVVETIRNVAQGMERPLPEWSEFGEKFVKGLVVLIIGFIYTIPIWLIMGCFWAAALAVGGGEGTQENIVTLLSTGVGCISGLYGLIIGVLSPAILVNYAMTGEFGSAFRFGEIFGLITGNLGNYIIALILAWVASVIAGFGIIACGVGVLFTSFWGYLVMAHLFGQLQRASVATA